MGTLFGLAQAELGSAHNDVDLVSYPVGDKAIDGQRPWNTIDQCQHVGTEVVLELGVLEQIV